MVSNWLFLPVNEWFNGAESDFCFVLESGRSELPRWERVQCLLMAESSHWLTVNMHGAAYLGDKL